MAGLMGPGEDPAMMDAAPAPAGEEPMTPEDGAEPMPEDGEQATPEEEEANAEFIAQAQLVIYDKKAFPGILDQLDADDPQQVKEAIASVAAMVVKRVYESGKKAGKGFTGAVVLNAAKEVYEDLADTAARFRFIDFDADPDAFEGGFYLMMDKLRVMASEDGTLDQGAVEADWQMIMEQEQGGGAMPAPAAPEEML